MAAKRRILERDWQKVAAYIKDELKRRRKCKFRQHHERIWKEVDRQVAMEPMSRKSKNPDNRKQSWRAALELGELSRASEIISAGIRRLAFPENRNWFDAHSELPMEITEAGPVKNPMQKRKDGVVRALMAQQHMDFGFKGRQDLSIKEGLHHGSYVAEVDVENMLGVKGSMVKGIKAPVWVPHSMWNCYPDPSKAARTSSLFYNGNMIIVEYQKYSDFKRQKGEGWRQNAIAKIEKPPRDKDVEIINFFGDVVIDRKDGTEIYLPNVKVKAVDDHIVYFKENPLPYSRIIYSGYERLDVRDPYFVSPLIKMSPTQKIASLLANKFIDNVELTIERPGEYDGNDSQLVAQGGPVIAPGAMNATHNLANKTYFYDVGDPMAALAGLQFHMSELQKGTGVDAVRSGMSASVEQTATEVERTHQGSQIRTIDFLDKHELQGLRPFLYLQHEMNKTLTGSFRIYNPEVDAPDFEYVNFKDLPDEVHFEVTGSKSAMMEERRQQETMAVTNFLMSIGYNRIDIDTIAKEMYQDAGNKNAERFILQQGSPEETASMAMAENEQLKAQMEEMAAEMQKLQAQEASKIQEAQIRGQIEGAKAENERISIEMKAQNEAQKIENERVLAAEKLANEARLEAEKIEADRETAEYKIDKQMELEFTKANLQRETDESRIRGTETKKQEDAKEKQDLIELANAMREKMEMSSGGFTVVRGDDGRAVDIVPKRQLDS